MARSVGHIFVLLVWDSAGGVLGMPGRFKSMTPLSNSVGECMMQIVLITHPMLVE